MFRTAAAQDPTELLILAGSGNVLALDPRTGELRWQHDLRERLGYGPIDLALTDTRVVVAAQSANVLCFEYASGKLLWEARSSRMQGRTTLLLQGPLTFLTRESTVDCFNAAGQRVWTRVVTAAGAMAMGFPGNVVQADTG